MALVGIDDVPQRALVPVKPGEALTLTVHVRMRRFWRLRIKLFALAARLCGWECVDAEIEMANPNPRGVSCHVLQFAPTVRIIMELRA